MFVFVAFLPHSGAGLLEGFAVNTALTVSSLSDLLRFKLCGLGLSSRLCVACLCFSVLGLANLRTVWSVPAILGLKVCHLGLVVLEFVIANTKFTACH